MPESGYDLTADFELLTNALQNKLGKYYVKQISSIGHMRESIMLKCIEYKTWDIVYIYYTAFIKS